MRPLDRDFDNLRAAHLWSLEHADADVALRLVAALREYAFRCMHAEITGWADAAIARSRAPTSTSASRWWSRSRRTAGSSAAISRARSSSATTPSPPPSRLGVDCSGLAERALANALFYQGDSAQGIEWMERMIASARVRFTGPPRARAVHAVGRVHERRRQRQGRAARRRGRGPRRGVRLTDRARPRRSTRSGSRSSRRTRTRPRPTCNARPTSPARRATGGSRRSRSPRCSGSKPARATHARRSRGYADVIDLWYRGGDWANQWLSLRHVFGILVQLRAHLGAATLHGALDRGRRGVRAAVRGRGRRAHHRARRRAPSAARARAPSPPRSAGARHSATVRSSTSCASRSTPCRTRRVDARDDERA